MPIDLSCSACGRTVTRPRWFQGAAYGVVCFREVAGRAVERARRRAGLRVRVSQLLPSEVDPRQVEMFEEAACT